MSIQVVSSSRYYGGVAFADEIALLPNSMQGPQSFPSIAYRYSKKWRNLAKCSVLQFAKENNKRIRISSEIIQTAKKIPNLVLL